MPEQEPVTTAPAAEPTKAPEPAIKAEALSPASQPTATDAEKEARKAARIANARRQFERLESERHKFQSEQTSWREQSAQALRDAAALRELRRLADQDPIKALEAMGHKFEDVLKKTASRGALTPETVEQQVTARVKSELAQFKAQMDEAARVNALKQQEAMRDSQTRAAKDRIREIAKANPDKYEFAGQSDESVNAAFDLMVKTYEVTTDPKTGKGHFMSFEEALDTLEEAELNEHLARNEKSKKVKAALESKAAKAKEEADKAAKEAAAKASPARKQPWQRKTEQAAQPAPLTAASQAPNQPAAESVPHRPLNIADKIQRNLERYRAARASNDA